jgi:SOS-response transcriptional repressor LexA
MTKLQHDVFAYVSKYIRVNNVSPTYAEITKEIRLTSRSHAYKIVERLVNLGYLAKNKKSEERNITIPSRYK